MASKGGAAPTNLGKPLPEGGELAGPLYTGPVGNSSLGAEPVGGPAGGKSAADPLKLMHVGKKGKK